MTFGHKKIPSFHSGFLLVARLGLEPRLTVPKTAVLPIRRSGILPEKGATKVKRFRFCGNEIINPQFARVPYLKHIPEIIKPFAKHLIFNISNASNEIYLTFDDGPHPTITPWVLDKLDAYSARGNIFFS